MRTLLVCLALTASSLAWGARAPWHRDCRKAAHACRETKGASLHPALPGDCRLDCGPTPVPITLHPYTGYVSQNCSRTPDGCVSVEGPLEVNGHILCPPVNVMAVCSFPVSPTLILPVEGRPDCVKLITPTTASVGTYCLVSSPSGAFLP